MKEILHSKVKIGMIVDNDFFDDIRVSNEAFSLAESGFQVVILCFTKKEAFPHKNIHIVPVNISNFIKSKLRPFVNTLPVYFWIWRYKLEKFVRNHRIDVLHIHDLYLAVPAIKSGIDKRIPLVLDLHENFPAAIINYKWTKSIFRFLIRPELWKKKEEKILSRVNTIIVLSQFYKEQLNKKYGIKPENILVYPNVPDTESLLNYPIDEKIFNKNNKFIILYFGVIAERRGLRVIVDSISILKKSISNFAYLLIGPVDNADKEFLARESKRPENKSHIYHVGYQDISTLPSWINKSDVCISPIQKSEQHDIGVANKVFQYMLMEKPIIVSDSLAQKEIVEQENCGLIFKHDSPNELADRIIMLFNNPQLSKQFASNGRKAVLSKYNLHQCSKVLIDYYNKLELSIE